MRYLMEHEAGYDPVALGFPSIMGCHAICFVTDYGLYGYHNAGGSGGAQVYQQRAALFRDYVKGVLDEIPKGSHLYGCSFVGNNLRGYPGDPRAAWLDELRAFSAALGYGGPISGYDLNQKLGGPDSAYVEYRRPPGASTCQVFIRKWSGEDHPTRADNPRNPYQKNIVTRGNQPATTVAAIPEKSLTKVVPTLLYGGTS